MTNPAWMTLDQAELLQLALNAGARDDAATAIGLLKEAVARADASATAHYLLGVEYAQGRLYDRAIDEMEAAIALDPGLSIARFQLGLLLLCAQQSETARRVLQPLAELSAGHYLHRFGAALACLIDDRLAEACEQIGQGIASNQENPALNTDMSRLAEEIRKVLPTTASAQEEDGNQAHHVLLSAYMGNTLP